MRTSRRRRGGRRSAPRARPSNPSARRARAAGRRARRAPGPPGDPGPSSPERGRNRRDRPRNAPVTWRARTEHFGSGRARTCPRNASAVARAAAVATAKRAPSGIAAADRRGPAARIRLRDLLRESRGGRIRTGDLPLPKRALYQAELHPVERDSVRRPSGDPQPTSTTTSRRGPWTPSTRSSPMSDVADGPDTSTIGRPVARRRREALEELGHGLDHLVARDDADVQVRHERDRSPSLSRAAVERHVSRVGACGRACRHRTVQARRAPAAQPAVDHELDAAGAERARQVGSDDDARRAVRRERQRRSPSPRVDRGTTAPPAPPPARRTGRRPPSCAPAPRSRVLARHVRHRRAVGERRRASARARRHAPRSRASHHSRNVCSATPGSVARPAPAGERAGEPPQPPVAHERPLQRARHPLRPLVPLDARERAAERAQAPALRARAASARTTFARSCTRIRGMSIPTGHTSAQAPQSVDAYGSDAETPRSPWTAAAAGSRRSGRRRPCGTRARRSGGRPGRR